MANANTHPQINKYVHTKPHSGWLCASVISQELFIDSQELIPVQTRMSNVKRLYKAMSDKLFLLETVLFLIYLSLLWISVLTLSYTPASIVLIRILRITLVISECCLFLQERRVRKRLRLLERKDILI